MSRLCPVLGAVFATVAPAQFQVVQQIQGAGNPFSVFQADLNDDGLPDLAALNRGRGAVLIWFGQAGGGFGPPLQVPTSPNDASFLAVGDLDNDRRQDVLVLGDTGGGGSNRGITVRLGQAGGSFQPAVTIAISGFPADPRLGDLDNDGHLDLVYRDTGASILSVHLGTGTGLFGPQALHPVWPVPADETIADLDGDGNQDVALAIGLADLVHVLWGDGTGGFPTSSFAPVSGIEPAAVIAGDVDGDGDLDLLVAAARSGEVDVLRNDGARRFTETGRYFTRPSPTDLALGDLDGDGSADLAVTHGSNPGYFAFLHGDGAGAFPMTQWFQLPVSGAGEGVLSDLDLDGRNEVLVPAGSEILVIGDPVALPAGVQSYGAGTPGCRGGLGITGSSSPAVANAGFAFLASNAPADAFGLVALGIAQDLNGSDPFGVGALLHVGLSGPVLTDPFPTDASGVGYAPAPIPANPGLAGLQFYAQGVWLEQRTGYVCTTSPLGLVTSRGLGVTIQP